MAIEDDVNHVMNEYDQTIAPDHMGLDDAIEVTEDLIDQLRERLHLLRDDKKRAEGGSNAE